MTERIRVLIADASAETRGQLSELLASEAEVVVIGTATNGTDALALAEKLQPDVLLLDTAMPGLDGIAATERLANRLPAVGVIMMSNQGEAHDWRRAMLAGARDFLVRPIAGEELISSIRQVHTVQLRERERMALAASHVASSNGHAPPVTRPGGPGKIVVLFSPKGGVGRTTLAVNLGAAAVKSGHEVCLVDASFQFGDVGIMLDLNPKNGSIGDLLTESARGDPESVVTALAHHSSGLRVLLAPPSPEVGELIQPDDVRSMLEALRTVNELVIVDTSNWFNDTTLAILDVADVILGVMTLEITNIKNMRLFLQLADSLSYLEKLQLVLNRSDATLGIKLADAEQSLGRRIDHSVVSDGRTVVYALNRGVPFSASNPEAQVSRDVKRLAEHLLRADVPVPAEPVDPRKRRKSLLAWR
jgi:pilus assembly protein CpaE